MNETYSFNEEQLSHVYSYLYRMQFFFKVIDSVHAFSIFFEQRTGRIMSSIKEGGEKSRKRSGIENYFDTKLFKNCKNEYLISININDFH